MDPTFIHLQTERGIFVKQFVNNSKRIWKHTKQNWRKNKTEQEQNTIQDEKHRFNSPNNANRIIIFTTKDVQRESSLKCIRESLIESISKLFEIAN